MTINIFIAGRNGIFLRYTSSIVPANGDEILLSSGKLVVSKRAFYADREIANLLCTPVNQSFASLKTPPPMTDQEFEKSLDKLFED